MRIGIDNISPGESTSRQGPGGMRMYLQSLLVWFSKLGPQNEYLLFTPDWADPLLDVYPPNVELVALRGVPRDRTARVIYQQTVLPIVISRCFLDVFFATATIAPLLCSVPLVLAVQFIQFFQFREAAGKFRNDYLKLMLSCSLRKAQRSIIFTGSSKQDLIHWTGISPSKVIVIPHGLSSDVWRVAELPPNAPERQIGPILTKGRPYIVCISATYSYKNHVRLIQAFGALKQRMKFPHVLLLVGSQVSVTYKELQSVAEQAGVSCDVIFAGRLDPNERALATYLSADFAVIPTLYETFGYPLLEAMLCGCPVVTSNIGSMSELSDGNAVLVDPWKVNDIADGIQHMLVDPVLRENLRVSGREHARTFTIERSMMQTLRILEKVGRDSHAHIIS